MIEFQIHAPKEVRINKKLIRLGIEKSLTRLNRYDVDITIRITDDSEMLQLNQTFRGVVKSTDVLSFNQDTMDPETQRFYLGDIIISYERVREQAKEHGNSFDEECVLLAIHGTLHLLGFDHYEKEEKEVMWHLQEEILNETMNRKQDKTS